VVGGHGPGLLAVPLVALAASVALLGGARAGDFLPALPWWLLPFLPPVVFSAVSVALEGRRLARDVRLLRAQLRGDAAGTAG
jgi:hypothetical protein